MKIFEVKLILYGGKIYSENRNGVIVDDKEMLVGIRKFRLVR